MTSLAKKGFLAPAKNTEAAETKQDVFKPQFSKKAKKTIPLSKTENKEGETHTVADEDNKKEKQYKKSKNVVNPVKKLISLPTTKPKLTANGVPPKILTDNEYQEIFESVLSAPESLYTQESTTRDADNEDHKDNGKENRTYKPDGKKEKKHKDKFTKPPKLLTEDEYQSIFDDVISCVDDKEKDEKCIQKTVEKQKKKHKTTKEIKKHQAITNIDHDEEDKNERARGKTLKREKHEEHPNDTENKQKAENNDSDSETEKGTWIQCTQKLCGKWRYVEGVHDPTTVPDDWECSMNLDEEHNTCQKPEIHFDESDHIFTKYAVGSVVWAKMDGYPWWPAMVDYDPDHEIYVELASEKSMVPIQYHVSFFDDPVSRAWVRTSAICPYVSRKRPISNGTKQSNVKKDVKHAIGNAEKALGMIIEKRVKKFGFTSRFSGKIRPPKKVFEPTKQKRKPKTSIFSDIQEKHSAVSSDDELQEEYLSCTSFEEETEYLPVGTKSRRKKSNDGKEISKKVEEAVSQVIEAEKSEEDSESETKETKTLTEKRGPNGFKFDPDVFTMDMNNSTKRAGSQGMSDPEPFIDDGLIENESEIDDWDEKINCNKQTNQSSKDNVCDALENAESEHSEKGETLEPEHEDRNVKTNKLKLKRKIPKGELRKENNKQSKTDSEVGYGFNNQKGNEASELPKKIFSDTERSKKKKSLKLGDKNEAQSIDQENVSQPNKVEKVPKKKKKNVKNICEETPKSTDNEESNTNKRKYGKTKNERKQKKKVQEVESELDGNNHKNVTVKSTEGCWSLNEGYRDRFEKLKTTEDQEVPKDLDSHQVDDWNSDKENMDPHNIDFERNLKKKKKKRSDEHQEEAFDSNTPKKAKKRLFAEDETNCKNIEKKSHDVKSDIDTIQRECKNDTNRKENNPDEKIGVIKKKKPKFTPACQKAQPLTKDGEVPTVTKEQKKKETGQLSKAIPEKSDLHVVPDIVDKGKKEISPDIDLLETSQYPSIGDLPAAKVSLKIQSKIQSDGEEEELSLDQAENNKEVDEFSMKSRREKDLLGVQKANINHIPPKNIFSSDDSDNDSVALSLEEDQGNKIRIDAEVHGRFGGRCYEHGSDSDPLELIED